MNTNQTKQAVPSTATVAQAIQGKPLLPALTALSRILQALPPGLPLKARATRLLLGRIRRFGNRIVYGREGLRFLVPNVQEPIAEQIFHDGYYEHETLAALGRRLRPGGHFLDIGANIGSISVPASRRVGPQGKVWSIECSAKVLPYLATNIEMNQCSNIKVVPFAVCDQDGATLKFYEAPTPKFGMGSLGPQFTTTPVTVTARTLDSLASEYGIDNISAMKMDVEGAEGLVVAGGRKFFEKNSPLVVYEFMDWSVERLADKNQRLPQALLEEMGYETWILEDFLAGKPPLKTVLTTGAAMLVSAKKT